MRILGISGSLRKDSHNTALLRAAAELLPPGVELELFDGLRDVPPYDADQDAPELHAPGVIALKEAIDSADAVLIATPEYNHSIPGVLKNALDWASRPVAESVLRGKDVIRRQSDVSERIGQTYRCDRFREFYVVSDTVIQGQP